MIDLTGARDIPVYVVQNVVDKTLVYSPCRPSPFSNNIDRAAALCSLRRTVGPNMEHIQLSARVCRADSAFITLKHTLLLWPQSLFHFDRDEMNIPCSSM